MEPDRGMHQGDQSSVTPVESFGAPEIMPPPSISIDDAAREAHVVDGPESAPQDDDAARTTDKNLNGSSRLVTYLSSPCSFGGLCWERTGH